MESCGWLLDARLGGRGRGGGEEEREVGLPSQAEPLVRTEAVRHSLSQTPGSVAVQVFSRLILPRA